MASTTALPCGPLRAKDVGVSAGGTRILQTVDLTLHPGEMCALIGPSGAGKSTLIKVLLGLRKPDEGSVAMGRHSMEELGPIGYVPQDDVLHRGLTVERELAYAAELRMPETSAEERRARIAEVLAQVDLADRFDVRIRKLSGGQRKRVSVALELLTGPPVLILDEPTSGLDPGLEARTMTLLSKIAATGRIVLVATHAMASLDKAQALCVLVAGRLAYFGPPRKALPYFRVDRYPDIFRQLDKRPPSAWALASGRDPEQQAFLHRAGPAPRSSPATDAAAAGGPSDVDEALERLKERLGHTEAP